MKKICIFLTFVFLFVFTACEQTTNIGNDDPIDINQIQVPEDFNYRTIQSVYVDLSVTDNSNEPIEGIIFKIYDNDPEDDGRFIAKGMTLSDGAFNTIVAVPCDCEQLTVVSPFGTQEVPIINGELQFEFGDDTYLLPDTPCLCMSSGKSSDEKISESADTKRGGSISDLEVNEEYERRKLQETAHITNPQSGLIPDDVCPTKTLPNIDAPASHSEDGGKNTTYVPDDNFEQALIDWGYDDVLDDYVLTANINTVTSLDVTSRSISDLTGIEDFVALTGLYCWGNQLTTLDVSANTVLNDLYCYVNQLTSLDVSANTALTILCCTYNQLTSLDVSANTALEELKCWDNQLTNLDVSANTALTILGCHFNQLTMLNVKNGNNTNFTEFDASNNPNLTCIQVDDADWSTANWPYKDPTASYSEDCAYGTDTDGDGVPDDEDDYPDDPDRAFNNYTPSENTYYTLAFEDKWPSKGDYDFNDIVILWSYMQVTNASNELVDIHGSFKLEAIGAGYHNGFGVQFPFAISNFSAFDDHGDAHQYVDTGTNNAVVILFQDAFNLMQEAPGDPSTWINTVESETYITPAEFEFTYTLDTPIAVASLTRTAPYNPFIYVNDDRQKEIHLPDYEPTIKMAGTPHWGTCDDDSDPTAPDPKYFKTSNNLPWAINVADEWDYPIELSPINWAYLFFVDWAENGGNTHTDWYDSSVPANIDANNIYSP
ncbi:MAG: LruC domain-containing protein [Candidatus Cloacimonetes bacterium]|nr:LruC domain-containing protein [Candidatus Cloacimonadota bacterium]